MGDATLKSGREPAPRGLVAAVFLMLFIFGVLLGWSIGSAAADRQEKPAPASVATTAPVVRVPSPEPEPDRAELQGEIAQVREEIRKLRLSICILLDQLGTDSTGPLDREACGIVTNTEEPDE